MKAEIKQTGLAGCFEICSSAMHDERGLFVKSYHEGFYRDHGLECDFKECYYSVSKKNVLRGLHFQLPPFDCNKLAYCLMGEMMDVVVDLRVGSPTYGKSHAVVLNEKNRCLVYAPKGFAHGFYVLSDAAVMMYHVSNVYSQRHDVGIRWDSADIEWPTVDPIVSKRDRAFPTFKEFKSPFTF